jgi:subtilase family serine protease
MKRLSHLIHLGLKGSTKMIRSSTFSHITAATLFAAAIVSFYGALAVPAHGIASNQRVNLGPEDQSAQISVTVWLKLRNEAALDALLQQMYDKNSPNYHRWLNAGQFKSQFGPTAQDVATVRDFLESRGMKVSAVHENNRFIVAQGRVGDAQRAFNTQISRVMVNGNVSRVSTPEPSVTGPAGAVVASVRGLSDHRYLPNVRRPSDPETNVPYAGVSPSSRGPDGLFFSSDCLRPPQTVNFTTNGGLPKATYTGNRYGANITNQNPPNLPPCGYDAAEMQKAYGLKPLFNQGLDGTGQTIVIVDAFGSNTIVDDANLFSQLNGLPPLVPGVNFQIIKPTGPVKCTVQNGCVGGWNFETTLDVEWAHAMAPKANIVLVVSVDNSDVNLDVSNLYAIENQYGSVISNSFGIPEEVLLQEGGASELVVENQIAKTAAALGISQNVSSGDNGDDLLYDIFSFGIFTTSVEALADSPFVTAIGGTSTFLNNQNQIKLQTGWGTNGMLIADPKPNPPVIPPVFLGFLFGSGGGTSVFFQTTISEPFAGQSSQRA